MSAEMAKAYISVGALLNYIGPDRPEMQFAIKEIMRKNASPTQSDWKKLKRIGRFILPLETKLELVVYRVTNQQVRFRVNSTPISSIFIIFIIQNEEDWVPSIGST